MEQLWEAIIGKKSPLVAANKLSLKLSNTALSISNSNGGQKLLCPLPSKNGLLAWNSVEKCLAACRTDFTEDREDKDSSNIAPQDIQKLVCSSVPVHGVDSIAINKTATFVALSGPQGVTVVELPKTWGRAGLLEGGRDVITCRSYMLTSDLALSDSRLTVQQCAWYPASPLDSHLIVLTSDNTLRVYDVTTCSQCESVYISPHGNTTVCGDISQASCIPTLLGDTAVGFDVAPPVQLVGEASSSLVAHPVYVLMGNGDVYRVLMRDLGANHRPSVEGPLPMQPASEDNYGSESCSVLCLPTTPPVLVLAETSGLLHHCLVLDGEEPSLYVYESVELELRLSRLSAEDLLGKRSAEDPLIDTPLRLHHDDCSTSRYHVSHEAGVHTVTVPWIAQMTQFCTTDGAGVTIDTESQCTAEHMVCTKPLSTSPALHVVGLCVVGSGWRPRLLCATTDGSVIAVSLQPDAVRDLPEAPASPSRLTKGGSRAPRGSLEDAVRAVLARNTNLPLIRGGGGERGGPEVLGVLQHAVTVLQGEYLDRQEVARQLIRGRAEVLSSQTSALHRQLEATRAEVSNMAAKATDMRAELATAADLQGALTFRVEAAARVLERGLPVTSLAEEQLKRQLAVMKQQAEVAAVRLRQLKLKHQQYRRLTTESGEGRGRPKYLNTTQEGTIRTALSHEGDDISSLVKQVKDLMIKADH